MEEFKILLRNRTGEIISYSLVDKEDYEKIKNTKWHLYSWNLNNGYAQGHMNNKLILMHKYLMNDNEDLIDHINNNRLDNRLSNLRKSCDFLNNYNRTKTKNSSSKYFGVHYDKSRKKYMAQIIKDGKHYSIGRFENEEEAAKARDKKAIELYGDFAKLNFPQNNIFN